MNQLLDWLRQVLSSWKCWIVVAPWDVGVRVRLGRRAVALLPGPHLRIPMLDVVLLVNTRLRVTTVPPVTVRAQGGRVRSVMGTVGYHVRDPLTALLAFESPEIAVQAYAQAEIVIHPEPEPCAEALGKYFQDKGIEVVFVRFVEDVEAPVLRLMQNSWGIQGGPQGETHPGTVRY